MEAYNARFLQFLASVLASFCSGEFTVLELAETVKEVSFVSSMSVMEFWMFEVSDDFISSSATAY